VIDLFQSDAGLASISDRRMSSTFESGPNRQCQFDQATASLIERARSVAALSQVIEGFSQLRMALAEPIHGLRQLLRHAGYLLPGWTLSV